jgi:hypothetical protein
LKDIARWARSSGLRGALQSPPPGNFAELAGVAVTFQYLNRMVTIFLPPSPLPPMTPKAVGGWVMGMLASAMTSASPVPGACLDTLPDAQLPEEFSWAASDSRIAAVLAGAAAAVEDAAEQVVTMPVRELVADRLRSWDGLPLGASRAWADEAVAGLDETDRPAGRRRRLPGSREVRGRGGRQPHVLGEYGGGPHGRLVAARAVPGPSRAAVRQRSFLRN